MIKEFKEFIKRGNVLDMAIGLIMGSAFSAIVHSLVNDVFMPAIGKLIGGLNFSEFFIALDGKDYISLTAATEAGAPVIKYGVFVNAIINFLVISFIIFLFVRSINKIRKKEVKEVEITTKECPFCKSEIALEASRCPHCTSELAK